MLTNLLTFLGTGDYTPDTKPFRVADKNENWVEYSARVKQSARILVCAARKHDCDPKMEQEYLDSHLSDIPKWANGKWERLGRSEIQSAIDLVVERTTSGNCSEAWGEGRASRKYQEHFSAHFRNRTGGRTCDQPGLSRPRSGKYKPPLDPAFTRAALLNNGKDEGLSRGSIHLSQEQALVMYTCRATGISRVFP